MSGFVIIELKQGVGYNKNAYQSRRIQLMSDFFDKLTSKGKELFSAAKDTANDLIEKGKDKAEEMRLNHDLNEPSSVSSSSREKSTAPKQKDLMHSSKRQRRSRAVLLIWSRRQKKLQQLQRQRQLRRQRKPLPWLKKKLKKQLRPWKKRLIP